MARLRRAGKIVLDEERHCLVVDTVRIDVDPKPFEIIWFLALNAHRTVSNQEIKTVVWQGSVTEQNYRVTLSNANARFKEALRVAYPEVQPTSFYTRPKPNHLQWALGELEDIDPPREFLPISPPTFAGPPVEMQVVGPTTTRPSSVQWFILAGTIMILAFLGPIAKRWLPRPEIRQVRRIRVQTDTVFALDQQGREVWQHVFPEGLGTYPSDEDQLRELYDMADLDGDGHTALIVVQIPPPLARATKGSRIACFRDGELVKTLEPGRTLVLGPDSKGDRYAKPYHSVKVLVIPGKPHPKVAIVSLHHEDAPCQVLILNHQLNIVGEYWHPGHLNVMELGDIDQDGRVELLLGGVNNRHHSATLIGLDPEYVSGTTRPIIDPRVPDHTGFALLKYGDDEAHLSNIPQGTEKYVVLFPRSYLSFKGQRALHFYNRVRHIGPSPGLMSVEVTENETASSPERILYDLDWKLNVIAAKPTKLFQDLHWKRFEEGTLDHQFSNLDVERLESNVVVRKYR